jgi:hypothetical protein
MLYSPDRGWEMVVSVPGTGTVPSGARAIIGEWGITLFIPESEIADPDAAGYRVTAFEHLGDFGMNPPFYWSGDLYPVVGAPLAPLAGPDM